MDRHPAVIVPLLPKPISPQWLVPRPSAGSDSARYSIPLSPAALIPPPAVAENAAMPTESLDADLPTMKTLPDSVQPADCCWSSWRVHRRRVRFGWGREDRTKTQHEREWSKRFEKRAARLFDYVGMKSRPDPRWLRGLLGEDFFNEVEEVSLKSECVTNAGLKNLGLLTNLQMLSLEGRDGKSQ